MRMTWQELNRGGDDVAGAEQRGGWLAVLRRGRARAVAGGLRHVHFASAAVQPNWTGADVVFPWQGDYHVHYARMAVQVDWTVLSWFFAGATAVPPFDPTSLLPETSRKMQESVRMLHESKLAEATLEDLMRDAEALGLRRGLNPLAAPASSSDVKARATGQAATLPRCPGTPPLSEVVSGARALGLSARAWPLLVWLLAFRRVATRGLLGGALGPCHPGCALFGAYWGGGLFRRARFPSLWWFVELLSVHSCDERGCSHSRTCLYMQNSAVSVQCRHARRS